VHRAGPATIRSLGIFVAYAGGLLVGEAAAAAKTKKPAAVDEPPSSQADAEKRSDKLRLEIATCAPEDLAPLDGATLAKLVETRCRTLRIPEGAAPTEIGDDEMLVALCTRREASAREAIDPKACGLEASVQLDGGKTFKLGADGELALSLRTAKVVRDGALASGAAMTLVASAGEQSLRAPLTFRRSVEGYAQGRVAWLPMPMLTTDFSREAGGYRLGITPVAVGLGLKWFPATGSSGYVGLSAFGAWNLLIPNDTQTLTNGTSVRVNYKAVGAGLLLDASGYFGVGAGFGRTFTTDTRTDFRMWFYIGPRLLSAFHEL
jgi:hypothetical protein